MNILHWADQHLDYRCAFMTTHLNIQGESEEVEVRLLSRGEESVGERRVVLIDRKGKPSLRVYLDDIEPMTLTMYHVETRDGETGFLIIPFPKEDDDGC